MGVLLAVFRISYLRLILTANLVIFFYFIHPDFPVYFLLILFSNGGFCPVELLAARLFFFYSSFSFSFPLDIRFF